MKETTAEVLRSARATLSTPKVWGKANLNGDLPPGCDCAYTAIHFEGRYSPTGTTDECLRLFAKANGIRIVPTRPMFGIANWNDAPERTHAEVLAAFDKAIELAEPRRSKSGRRR